MARGRGFSGRSAIRAPKRQIGNSGLSAVIDGMQLSAAPTKAVFDFGLAATEAASTLVRTRGHLLVRYVATAATTRLVRGAFGGIVVSQDAFDVGVTALPGPVSDVFNDWFLWAGICITPGGSSGESNEASIQRVDLDSRGMRKIKLTERLVFMLELEADTPAVAEVVDAMLSLRLQEKL